MGKTSLLLSYYARNLRRRKSKRHRIALVHLGTRDADARIEAITERRRTALFLDAFDEDTRAIRDHRSRIRELIALTEGFRRIVITSRTQFFPSDEEIPQDTGILKIGARGMERATYEFRKLYLAPFSDQMVNEYLRKRFSLRQIAVRRQATALIKKVPLLTVRPMLLTHIPDLIGTKIPLRTAYDIYEQMVQKWYEREAPWVDPPSLSAFSLRLAVDIFVKRAIRGSEQISASELRPFAKSWSIPLDDWQLRGRSLLNRDAVGNFKFAHRSIMEFLVARVIIEGREQFAPEPIRVAYHHLSTFLEQEIFARTDKHRAVMITGDLVGSDVVTDQINSFLSDVVATGRSRSLDLRIAIGRDDFDAFVRDVYDRSEFLARTASKDRNFIPVLAWLLAPPVYFWNSFVHGYTPIGGVPFEYVRAVDHAHGIVWLIAPDPAGWLPQIPQNFFALISGPMQRWEIPTWKERLATLDQVDKSERLSNWNPVTAPIIENIGRQMSPEEAGRAVLAACNVAFGTQNLVVRCQQFGAPDGSSEWLGEQD